MCERLKEWTMIVLLAAVAATGDGRRMKATAVPT
jgi:hypothetical protein